MILQYSRFALENKPKKFDARTQLANEYEEKDCTIEEMFSIMTHGHCWRAGVYDLTMVKGFSKTNVKSASLIALDFDKVAFTPQEVIAHAKSIGFTPNLFYYSYSQGVKEGNNFRIVWVFEKQITMSAYENTYKLMLREFDKFSPDVATKDASRLWYGSCHTGEWGGGIVSHKPTLYSTIGWLHTAAALEENKRYGDVKRNKKNHEKDYSQLDMPDAVRVKPNWYEKLRGRCAIWDMFERGEHLPYNTRLALCTNLRLLKRGAGSSIYNDFLAMVDWSMYEDSSFDEAQLKRMFSTKLPPLPICRRDNGTECTMAALFNEEPEDLSTKIDKNSKITIKELDDIMNKDFPKYLEQPGVAYIKSQTASGKTKRVIDWMLSKDLSQVKIIYAIPTHETGLEFEARFIEAHNARCIIGDPGDAPILRTVAGEYSQEDILRMKVGLKKKKNENKTEAQKERDELVVKFNRSDWKGVFVCTHSMLAGLSPEAVDYIIIDENPEDAFVHKYSFKVSDLFNLTNYLEGEDMDAMVQLTLDCQRTGKLDFPKLQRLLGKVDEDKYIKDKNIAEGIFFLKDKKPRVTDNHELRLITRSLMLVNAWERGIPVKMLTATPKRSQLMIQYKEMPVETIVFPTAANEGQIIQYSKNSGARGSNNSKVPSIIAYAQTVLTKEQQRDSFVISFKGSEEMWEDAGFKVARTKSGKLVHLQNSAGLDFLKGEDVIVAGKFDLPDTYYEDQYFDLGNEGKPIKKMQVIELNGIRQKLFLYEDPALRAIQLDNIELNVAQSVGRARALRAAGATVFLFGNYVIEDVDKVI